MEPVFLDGENAACPPNVDSFLQWDEVEEANMNSMGQAPKGPHDVMKPILNPRKQMKIGIWNVRTMHEVGKTAQVIKQQSKYNIDILGVSECRWTGFGRMKTQTGETIIYSGRTDGNHSHGVAIIMKKGLEKSMMSWKPISERMIKARFHSKHTNLTMIQCYAPTNESSKDEKEKFYEMLQKEVTEVPAHDMLIVAGDLNAKVGQINDGHERTMGKHGLGTRNENGEMFINFCGMNSLVIGGSLFPHKDIHKITWISPDRVTRNQIDHIAIRSKYRRSLHDVKARRGADVGSDHELVISKIKLKLRVSKKPKSNTKRYAVEKLKEPAIKEKFCIELRNRFSALEEVTEEVEGIWENISDIYNQTADKILGKKKRRNEEWISEASWKMIDERQAIKGEYNQAKSNRLREAIQQRYINKGKQVKKSLRRDKRECLNKAVEEAQDAADKKQRGVLYKIIRNISGKKGNEGKLIRDQDGNIITNEEKELERWKEHFSQVLNREPPRNPMRSLSERQQLDINIEEVTEEEIIEQLKSLRNAKAPGIDNLNAELFKADMETAVKQLHQLFKYIWREEHIPEDWKKGIIAKIPKKGDITVCNNWRGITLLSIPSKVLAGIIIKRISNTVDEHLRKEQAGFRPGRGCSNQIFILKNIIEQCNEWNTSLYINFIDFEKAFDSVHRESLWKIMAAYGIPSKLINMVKIFYSGFTCSVAHNGQLTERFEIKTGVRQGCVMSGFLFLLIIDWVMSETTSKKNGVRWGLQGTLEDLDFADDIALLSENRSQLQDKTNRLIVSAQRVGLNLNKDKCKVMSTKAKSNETITVNGEPLKDVNNFTYLGSTLDRDGKAERDIDARINKARSAFISLNKVWKSNIFSTRVKLQLYSSLVKSILLYSAETWELSSTSENKLNAFNNKCLRKILKVFWPNIIPNNELRRRTGTIQITEEIKRRRWRWIGHVLRREPSDLERVVLTWHPQGRRGIGRPRKTWRRMVETERQAAGWRTWGEVAAAARDRENWRTIVERLIRQEA